MYLLMAVPFAWVTAVVPFCALATVSLLLAMPETYSCSSSILSICPRENSVPSFTSSVSCVASCSVVSWTVSPATISVFPVKPHSAAIWTSCSCRMNLENAPLWVSNVSRRLGSSEYGRSWSGRDSQ